MSLLLTTLRWINVDIVTESACSKGTGDTAKIQILVTTRNIKLVVKDM